MTEAEAQSQQQRWQRLAALADKIQRSGPKSLTTDELFEYGRLYRRASSDLSLSRSYGLDQPTTEYLNRLVGRTYAHLYRTPGGGVPSLRRFFSSDFPRAVRRHFGFVAAAFLIFLAGGGTAYWATWKDPDNASIFIDPGMLEGLAQRHTRQGGKGPDFIPSEWRPIASSRIMTNNITVSFIAFAGGVAAGLGTIAILLFNGLHLGVVAAAINQQPVAISRNFWSFVCPHGVIELPAIFIAAAAGLILGFAIVNPGDYTRRDALKLAGREAIQLVIGVVGMLIVAGIIEGFLSPAPEIPESLKFLFGAVMFIALCAYLGLAGRDVIRDA